MQWVLRAQCRDREALEIPVGTAKSRLAYGLKSLRKHLKESGGSHG
jgi:DNA-directed RNA polymerase specialized sigma24 family protein